MRWEILTVACLVSAQHLGDSHENQTIEESTYPDVIRENPSLITLYTDQYTRTTSHSPQNSSYTIKESERDGSESEYSIEDLPDSNFGTTPSLIDTSSGDSSQTRDDQDSEQSTSTENPTTKDISAEKTESAYITASTGIEPEIIVSQETNDNEPIVVTEHGPVIGFKWEETNVIAFIDIPYGEVNSPFEPPRTAQSWTDVHDIKEHTSRCPQYENGFVGDLNCLTLSIFTPENAQNASVLFYVHDERFGSGDPMVYGPEHLVPRGVILVLPNYRFGALGFLCLQDSNIVPGNAGLKDLSKALNWVESNIQAFGGNPSNIVVGGDGSAGALAGYLAMSSQTKSYIHKVITESGSLLSHLAFDRDPLGKARTLAAHIANHSDVISSNYLRIFANVSVRVIVEAAKDMRFNPCIERNTESFMEVTPWTLLQSEQIDTTFMIGSASHAGAHEAVEATDAYIEKLNADLGLMLPEDLKIADSDERTAEGLRVKTQYFGNDTITADAVKELSLWYTDASYLYPLVRSARPLVAAGATVYLYEFDFVGNLNRESISLGNPVEGAVRNDIIGYLFTKDGLLPLEDTPEEKTIDLMVDLWVSFIETGTPTAENVEWQKLEGRNETDDHFLLISANPRPMQGLHVDRLRLWSELYDQYFIERNFAYSLTPGYSILIAITFWVTHKLLYH